MIFAVEQGLGEEVEAIAITSQVSDQVSLQPSTSSVKILGNNNTGIAASSGLAFGPVHVIKPKVINMNVWV